MHILSDNISNNIGMLLACDFAFSAGSAFHTGSVFRGCSDGNGGSGQLVDH